jgi:hypothetical protein
MPKAYVVKTVYYEDGVRYSIPGIFDSLQSGKARIGWSSKDEEDLRVIKQTVERNGWDSLSPDQQSGVRCLGFLDRVERGDYLLYPHQPEANHLLIAKVKDSSEGDYTYSKLEDSLDGDFRSCRGCILLTPNPVPYDDRFLLPYVQSRLGLQGRFYELREIDTLNFTLDKLDSIPPFESMASESSPVSRSISVRLNRIRDEFSPQLTARLQREFLRHDLSWFCVELFRQLGYTVQHQEGAGEHGSDLVVQIRSELLPRTLRVGVQVKSYTDTVSLETFTQDIVPLIDGWEKNVLDYGAYLTTGACVRECLEYLRNHNAQHADRQIVLIDSTKLGHLFIRTIGRFESGEE